MSYDGWLYVDTGGSETVCVAEFENYTSNVAPMWRKALAAAGEDIRLSDTEGRTAEDVVPLLRKASAHMAEHPDEYTPLNPSNGWGDYDGARRYLRHIADVCEQHPKAYLHWSV